MLTCLRAFGRSHLQARAAALESLDDEVVGVFQSWPRHTVRTQFSDLLKHASPLVSDSVKGVLCRLVNTYVTRVITLEVRNVWAGGWG